MKEVERILRKLGYDYIKHKPTGAIIVYGNRVRKNIILRNMEEILRNKEIKIQYRMYSLLIEDEKTITKEVL